MAERSRRRNVLIALAVIIIAILLLLTRCLKEKPVAKGPETPTSSTGAVNPSVSAAPAKAVEEPAEVLGAATVKAPERVIAGATFSASWTGPDNRGDYVTIVRREVGDTVYHHYRETKEGASLELTAPIEPGAYEVRYVTGRSKTVLARTPIEVVAAGATLEAPAEVVLGSLISVAWTGPGNKGDYVTIVAKDAPDAHYGSYAETDEGSPLTVTAPTATGDAELRYVTGEGRKVLARRAIKVIGAEITMSAPAEAIAGSMIEVNWTGPNNAGDYITVVGAGVPDGQYGNYANTSTGSPLKLKLPIMDGAAELRYMTGQGRKVLLRRPINIVAAEVTLSAPAECKAGTDISITWTGPNQPGDYITVVRKGTPDGQYAAYADTTRGSPLTVKAPKEAGEAEIRYASGQGNKVLARIPIKVNP